MHKNKKIIKLLNYINSELRYLHENFLLFILTFYDWCDIVRTDKCGRVACRSSSHFFLKHIIIAKNARYIIRNVVFYECSRNTITRMINYS